MPSVPKVPRREKASSSKDCSTDLRASASARSFLMCFLKDGPVRAAWATLAWRTRLCRPTREARSTRTADHTLPIHRPMTCLWRRSASHKTRGAGAPFAPASGGGLALAVVTARKPSKADCMDLRR